MTDWRLKRGSLKGFGPAEPKDDNDWVKQCTRMETKNSRWGDAREKLELCQGMDDYEEFCPIQ